MSFQWEIRLFQTTFVFNVQIHQFVLYGDGICLSVILHLMHRPEHNTPRTELSNANLAPRTWTDAVKLPKYAVFIVMRLLATRIVMGFADRLHEQFEGIPMDFILIVVIAVNSFFVDFLVFDAQKWYQLTEFGNNR